MASDNSPERDLGTPVDKKPEGDAAEGQGTVQPEKSVADEPSKSSQESPSQKEESKPSEQSHDMPSQPELSTMPTSTDNPSAIPTESTSDAPPAPSERATSTLVEETVSSAPAEKQEQKEEQSTQPPTEPQPSEPSDAALERKSTPPKEESQKEESPINPPTIEEPSKEGEGPPMEAAPKDEPSTELPAAEEPKEAEDIGISLMITLLLTTGARHPFRVSSKYLRKNAVNVPDYDPYAMSVYTLKELIWREWRSEWEPRPSSPSSIRLISFGKLLEDKSPLSESKFSRDSANVIHMTVKPQEVVEEEEAAKGGVGRESQNEGERSSPRCRCVIL